MRFDDEGGQAFEERVEISVQVDDEGNVITKKIVNGEEVEISEDDLQKLHVFEMKDGDDINVFIDSEEFGEEMKTLELEIEKLIEVTMASDAEGCLAFSNKTDKALVEKVRNALKAYNQKHGL